MGVRMGDVIEKTDPGDLWDCVEQIKRAKSEKS